MWHSNFGAYMIGKLQRCWTILSPAKRLQFCEVDQGPNRHCNISVVERANMFQIFSTVAHLAALFALTKQALAAGDVHSIYKEPRDANFRRFDFPRAYPLTYAVGRHHQYHLDDHLETSSVRLLSRQQRWIDRSDRRRYRPGEMVRLATSGRHTE